MKLEFTPLCCCVLICILVTSVKEVEDIHIGNILFNLFPFETGYGGHTNQKTTRWRRAASSDNSTNVTTTIDLRPDEIASDVTPDSIDVPASSQQLIVPNVTCLTADDLKHRIHYLLNDVGFGVNPKKKCPKKLPCKDLQSCSLWRTGFVNKRGLHVEKEAAQAFYSALFESLNYPIIEEILDNFSKCVQYYGLDMPFEGETNGDKETGVGHSHPSSGGRNRMNPSTGTGQRRRRQTESVSEHEKRMGAQIHSAEDARAGLLNCDIRIQDYYECLEVVVLKGLCYWAPIGTA